MMDDGDGDGVKKNQGRGEERSSNAELLRGCKHRLRSNIQCNETVEESMLVESKDKGWLHLILA